MPARHWQARKLARTWQPYTSLYFSLQAGLPCRAVRRVSSRHPEPRAGQEQDGTPPARGLARARTVRDESITGVRPTPTCRSFTTTIGGEAGRRAASTSTLVGRLVASPADHVAAAPNESGQRRMTQPCPPMLRLLRCPVDLEVSIWAWPMHAPWIYHRRAMYVLALAGRPCTCNVLP